MAWIKAFITIGITNDRTEGYNPLVKRVKRAACGFRDPANSARRMRSTGPTNGGLQPRLSTYYPTNVEESV